MCAHSHQCCQFKYDGGKKGEGVESQGKRARKLKNYIVGEEKGEAQKSQGKREGKLKNYRGRERGSSNIIGEERGQSSNITQENNLKEYHWGRSVEEGKVSWENREGKKYKYHGGREALLLIEM